MVMLVESGAAPQRPDPALSDAEIEAILDAMEEASPGKAEYLDGVFTMSRPQVVHQRTLVALLLAFNRSLAPELEALPDIQVVTAGAWIIPDLVVARRTRYDDNPKRLAPADVVLMIEITSPSTVRRDREAKQAFCAEHGIDYWIVDPGEPWGAIEAHALGEGLVAVPDPVPGDRIP
ncbi:MAG: Uma2 family endonuclease [Actinomycetota bacterium]